MKPARGMYGACEGTQTVYVIVVSARVYPGASNLCLSLVEPAVYHFGP